MVDVPVKNNFYSGSDIFLKYFGLYV